MFSWSKKKETKRRGRSDRESEENEFGVKIDRGQDDKQLEAELRKLAGVDSLPEEELNLNEGEDDVESELLRLIGGGGKGRKPVKKPSSDEPIGDISDLTADIDLGDEDVEVDENDPELLGELLDLTNPGDADIEEPEPDSDSEPEPQAKPSNGDSDILTILKERLKLYKTAEAKAKESNENSRARRFARGIKTLEDLLKKAKAGKPVASGDIPPVIALNLKPAPPPQPEMLGDSTCEGETEPEEMSPEASSTKNIQNTNSTPKPEDTVSILMERLKLYQTAETKAKESGETTRARRFNRGIKTLEGLLKQAKAGKQIAPEDIPPAVALNLKPAPPVPDQASLEENSLDDHEERDEDEIENINPTSSFDDSQSKESEEQERNIMDVLSERLQMYETAEAKAKENGDTSRARRFGRGIKTLRNLIKQATAGNPIAGDDIPPMIALNLKPAPSVAANEEEEPRDAAVERETLVRSSDPRERPLSFAAVEDVDLDEELLEEDMPTTVLEGLEQRVRLYSRFQEVAREEGNSNLAEQNERIVRVYLNAIKTFKAGGYVDVENLPNPRGCPPIPIPFFVP